jgi:hypothetical protein
MRPNHNPEFKRTQPPASSHRLDGRATDVITRQRIRMEDKVGRIDEAHLDDHEDTPLYGYKFELDGTAVELKVDMDANGEPVGPDREFVEARNRAAVLRSRERSKGSRRFNYSFRRNRGHGPGGHGYDVSRAEREYHDELSDFIARKISGHRQLNTKNQVTQAVASSVEQEVQQMSVLENMAAEQKSGTRLLNFFRNHKKLRIAAGLALSGMGMVGLATGQLEVAIPAFAARSALSTTGGYLLGRTGHDAFQGWRAKKQPHNDIRMAGSNNGDFSGRLTPRAAFERSIKLQGAEARAGSHDAKRQKASRQIAGLVHEYYTGALNFTPSRSQGRIRDEVESLFNGHIRPLQTERLKSDQTQSRKRHLAGVAGGIALGALSIAHPIGVELHPIGFITDHLGIGGGGHSADAYVSGHHTGSKGMHAHGHGGGSSANHNGAGKSGSSNPNTASTNSASSSPSGSGYGGNPTGGNTVTGSPNASTAPAEINIYGGPGNDTINVSYLHEAAAGHGAHGSHIPGAHNLHETFHGIPTGELHVKSGGGFISTLQEQYHLSPAQAEAAYHDMYTQLHGAPGTYLDGSDIRISSPGDFQLPDSARAVLEERLKALHRMPEHLLNAGITNTDGSNVHDAMTYGKTGGVKAPDNLASGNAGGAMVDAQTGGVIAPTADTAGNTVHSAVAGSSSGITIDGGSGSDHISVMLPNTDTAHGQALQAMVDNHYVPETGVGNLTSEQAAQAQAYLEGFVHNGSSSTLSPGAKAAVEQYTQASIEHPGQGVAAHQAAERLQHLWAMMGHNLNNLTQAQAQSLENDLVIANT